MSIIFWESYMHADLLLVTKTNGWTLEQIKHEEGEEYGAVSFTLLNKKIQFRVSKITPTKNGQFVTLWKRIGKGPIMPYDLNDPIDLFIVSVRKEEQLGWFIFPKSVLQKKDVVSLNGAGGKRAIRVYPPWDKPESRQAEKTQNWQLPYFVSMSSSNLNLNQLFIDFDR